MSNLVAAQVNAGGATAPEALGSVELCDLQVCVAACYHVAADQPGDLALAWRTELLLDIAHDEPAVPAQADLCTVEGGEHAAVQILGAVSADLAKYTVLVKLALGTRLRSLVLRELVPCQEGAWWLMTGGGRVQA
ncbi:MAG: hypothetical protein GY708_23770 [Actinomycetia bacterium]|nr:hypothetical protein [Actinomycetes bacterium]